MKEALDKTTHGDCTGKVSPEYVCWRGIKQRCFDDCHAGYARYGARGISMCARWRDSFENFLADMGRKPSPLHSIERRDRDGDYEPGNCYWADGLTQANNKSNNRLVVYRGKTMTLAQALRAAGNVVEKTTARQRLNLGWTVERSVEERA